jgi:hypothetical protein
VRCYATVDANPTKQLKNKLSQAAAARDGLLVLLLADEDAYIKAREALSERWMTNPEWPKSVACVALGFPAANPRIGAIIQRARNPWAKSLRNRVFPEAEILDVKPNPDEVSVALCSQCAEALPVTARFCSNCGTAVELRLVPG